MKIIVGSKNPQKIKAVEDLASIYEFLGETSIISVEVDSQISEQPMTLDEIILGAKNRAVNSFNSIDGEQRISFGLESGLMPVPHTKTGFMDICACAIYDGNDFYIGLSGGFEPPAEVVRLIHQEGMNMSDATRNAGLTKNEYIGHDIGVIGILTKSKINRLEYSKQAIQMALIRLENKHLY